MTQQARFRLPPELDELTKPEMLRLISEANLGAENEHTEPDAARLFARLSEEEMTHAGLLRECAASHADCVPEPASEVYEYLYRRQIEKAEAVRRYQEMYHK